MQKNSWQKLLENLLVLERNYDMEMVRGCRVGGCSSMSGANRLSGEGIRREWRGRAARSSEQIRKTKGCVLCSCMI